MAYIETRENTKGIRYIIRYSLKRKQRKIFMPRSATLDDARLICALINVRLSNDRSIFDEQFITKAYNALPYDLAIRCAEALGVETVRLSELFTEYQSRQEATSAPSSVEHDYYSWRRFRRFCNIERIEELSEETLKQTFDEMGKHFSRCTVQHTIGSLRTFGKWAVRTGAIRTSPFEVIKQGRFQRNVAKEYYVDDERVQEVLAACPTQEWRAVVVLWRYAGLRAAEPLGLTRDMIDYTKKRLTVYSPKTERYVGHSHRYVPMEKRVEQELIPLTALASGGDERIIKYTRHYLDSGFRKLMRESNIPAWPKIRQNLRISCENDWIAKGVPAHVAAAWLGHGTGTQERYYLCITPAAWGIITG